MPEHEFEHDFGAIPKRLVEEQHTGLQSKLISPQAATSSENLFD